MFDFLDLSSTTVVYEAANTLAALTNNSIVLKGYLLGLILLNLSCRVKVYRVGN
jgi:hypothetical protein